MTTDNRQQTTDNPQPKHSFATSVTSVKKRHAGNVPEIG